MEVLFVFAIIETGGKQYKVAEGDIIYVEKLNAAEGDKVTFDKVLALQNSAGFQTGAHYFGAAKESPSVVKNAKGKKIYVNTYKPKKNEKRKIGHRQPYTKVQIEAIEG